MGFAITATYNSSYTKESPTTISTILSPLEQRRVDVATNGAYKTLHRTSIDEVFDDLRSQKCGAVLLSVAQYDPVSTTRMAAMVRAFPTVPTYGLLTSDSLTNPHSVLSLGQVGIRSLIDARNPTGWEKLRELLVIHQTEDIQSLALKKLLSDLADCPGDCRRFFEVLFTHYPYISNVRQLARKIRVFPTTLLSRFYRVRLPSPKQYIDYVRLLRAARILENPGISIGTVARQLDYSSPQAFSRHTRCVLNVSPVEFRKRYSGKRMFEMFRERLVTPYLSTLLCFHPIAADPVWGSASYLSNDGSNPEDTDEFLMASML